MKLNASLFEESMFKTKSPHSTLYKIKIKFDFKRSSLNQLSYNEKKTVTEYIFETN